MKILISGATGLVATNLIPTLTAKGNEVFKLVRKAPKSADEIQWDSEKGFSDAEKAKLGGFDAVIHWRAIMWLRKIGRRRRNAESKKVGLLELEF